MNYLEKCKREDKCYPLVSIIIPVYNGSNYLEEAIESALSQTYPNIEVIVINDGSNDGDKTHRIALSYGDRIRYYQKPNGGVSSALNLGIGKMRGDYFSWLSHDDAYYDEKISRQMEFANMNTVIMCERDLIDKESQIISDIKKTNDKRFYNSMNGIEASIALLRQGCFNGCSLLIPRKAFDECGMFDERLRYCQDLLMWLNIFMGGYNLKRISYVGVKSRVHDKQLTNTGRELYHKDCKVLSKLVLERMSEISTKEKNVLYYFARYNAVYSNQEVFEECVSIGTEKGILSSKVTLNLKLISLYGRIRPKLRQLYYKIFRNIDAR